MEKFLFSRLIQLHIAMENLSENFFFVSQFVLFTTYHPTPCLCIILIYSENSVFCNSNRKIENKMLDENSLQFKKVTCYWHRRNGCYFFLPFCQTHNDLWSIPQYGVAELSLSNCVLFNNHRYMRDIYQMLICKWWCYTDLFFCTDFQKYGEYVNQELRKISLTWVGG